MRASAFSGTVTYSPVSYSQTTKATAGGTTANGAAGSQSSSSQSQSTATTLITLTTATTPTQSSSAAAAPPPAGPTCPVATPASAPASNTFACSTSTQVILDKNSKKYQIGQCGSQAVQTAGGAYYSVTNTQTFNQCFDLCDASTNCSGFTWSGSTTDSSGTGSCSLASGAVTLGTTSSKKNVGAIMGWPAGC